MSHQPQTIVRHDIRYAGRLHPGVHLIPADGIILQNTSDLMERNPRPVEHIGDFRHRARTAIAQPFPRHGGAIVQQIETRVIQRRLGVKIQHDDRHFRPPHHRQHRGRQGICRNMEENQIHVLATEPVARVKGFRHRINQSTICTPERASFWCTFAR